MPQSTLPWQWRGERRHARLYSHFRLHRTGHSDRHDAFGGGESSPATEFIIEGGRKRRLILRLRLRQQSRQPKEANGFANVPIRAPPDTLGCRTNSEGNTFTDARSDVASMLR